MKSIDYSNGSLTNITPADLIHRIVNRIRQYTELRKILETTVVELRSFLGTDRVKVYQFHEDGSGEVVAEAIYKQCLPSLLGLRFPAEDIPTEAKEMFLNARQRTIVDVIHGRIGLSPLETTENLEFMGEVAKTDSIHYRTVDPCHIEYLKAMGVQSSLVIPILHYDLIEEATTPKLWGLLVSHHSKPRTILKRELRFVQQVVDQVSIAIAQSHLLMQAQVEKQRETTISRVTTLLYASQTMQIQAALEASISALGGVGGRLYMQHNNKLYTWGTQPQLTTELSHNVLEQHPVWQSWVRQELATSLQNDCIWITNNLYKEPDLRVLAPLFQVTRIRGLLVMIFHTHQQFIGCLTIFRDEIDTEVLWAGQRDTHARQKLPRLSFEVWREQRKGQAPEWKPEEISLAYTLCHHFSIAIQQQQMHHQVQQLYLQLQALNLNLECQVKQQTAELQRSLQLAKVLKQITDQIRSTLELKEILQTIVREIHKLFKVDRVVIYQLLDDSSGEVVIEEVSGHWPSVLGIKAPVECFPDEYSQLYFRGRVRAINNVSAASISQCHREFLQSLRIQANLIVPIKMGSQLWGLLIAHQCHAPRDWQDDEIEFIQQLADQAAIAIQQAELYKGACTNEAEAKAKAAQLELALQELQQTQTQLIQTEKMSSLGQLVAGVAHEINNPVNFIYGNLSHAIEYTHDILELLRLYQIHYPYPNPEIDTHAEAIDLDFLIDDLPKMMSSMKVGADRIRSMVLSLRNFSRLDHSEMKPVDLHEGIENTILILQHRLKPHGECAEIQIIKEYGDLPLIECYAGQMNQVFMNILSNAIDTLSDRMEGGKNCPMEEHQEQSTFFSPQIRIATKVSADGSHVMIRIADNGLGMTEDVKKRMFDPFFTTKAIGKGTGLGLAISYQIVVEKHQGVMQCISEPGKGTEFWIEIPLRYSLVPHTNSPK